MASPDIFGDNPTPSDPAPCAECGGRLHVRGPEGVWGRCPCVAGKLTEVFIHRLIRGTDQTFDPVWKTKPPLALRTFIARGSYLGFRHAVWRALLAYEPRGLAYDVVTLDRLCEIRMQREVNEDETTIEDGYRSTRELVNLQLLILTIPTYEHPNKLNRSLLGQMLDERAAGGRPTWVFTHLMGGALAAIVGEDLMRRWFAHPIFFTDTGTDAHAPATSISAASAPDRSGDDAPRQHDYTPIGGRPRGH